MELRFPVMTGRNENRQTIGGAGGVLMSDFHVFFIFENNPIFFY